MSDHYFDHAATTPVRPEVLEAIWPFFADAYGNPGSVHGPGALANEAIMQARAMIAQVLRCRPTEIVFTSGGTEADNLALLGCARALRARGNHIITSAVEHDAVLQACRQLERESFRVTYLPVDTTGMVDARDLEAALTPDTILVSVMLANNEIGTIQQIADLSSTVRTRGIAFHTDAVQAAGMVSLNVDRLGVDMLTLSAHKIYGPKGVGLLYVRRGTPLEPLLHGGGQERQRRAGTENVVGMVGMAVALALAEQEREAEVIRIGALRDRLLGGVLARVPGAHLTGHPTQRLPGHASFYLEGVSGESVLVQLDMLGVACSSGSACHAGSTDPSHVLTAIGLPDRLARNGLRMTLGRSTTDTDVDFVVQHLPEIVQRLQTGQAVPA